MRWDDRRFAATRVRRSRRAATAAAAKSTARLPPRGFPELDDAWSECSGTTGAGSAGTAGASGMAGVTGVCFAGAVGSECVTGAVEMKVRSAVFASATGGIASCGALADVAVAATCVVTRGCTGTGAGVVAVCVHVLATSLA